MDNKRLFDIISALNGASDYVAIQHICTAFCDFAGFDHFIYAARIPTSMVSPHYIIINGYPDEWRSHYIESDYIRIDPTVSHCFSKITPIYWEEIVNTTCKQDKTINRLFCEAGEVGLRNGMSFPIHCIYGETAMFSIATTLPGQKSRAHVLQTISDGQLFAAYVHEAVKRIPDSGMLTIINSELTKRERECLLWTTEGKNSWEISQILNVSERTVAFHLNNAAYKLNVCNRQHAVARAISLGYVTPIFR